jgi:predicted transcriptional regulator
MRTTIRLDDELLREAKTHARATGRTLTQLIEDALRETLAPRRGAGQRPPIRLRTFKGSAVQPGVNLDSNAALLDLMDDID